MLHGSSLTSAHGPNTTENPDRSSSARITKIPRDQIRYQNSERTCVNQIAQNWGITDDRLFAVNIVALMDVGYIGSGLGKLAMTDIKSNTATEFKLPDPVKLMQNMARVFERASAIARQVAGRPDLHQKEAETQILPMEQVAKTLGEVLILFRRPGQDRDGANEAVAGLHSAVARRMGSRPRRVHHAAGHTGKK